MNNNQNLPRRPQRDISENRGTEINRNGITGNPPPKNFDDGNKTIVYRRPDVPDKKRENLSRRPEDNRINQNPQQNPVRKLPPVRPSGHNAVRVPEMKKENPQRQQPNPARKMQSGNPVHRQPINPSQLNQPRNHTQDLPDMKSVYPDIQKNPRIQSPNPSQLNQSRNHTQDLPDMKSVYPDIQKNPQIQSQNPSQLNQSQNHPQDLPDMKSVYPDIQKNPAYKNLTAKQPLNSGNYTVNTAKKSLGIPTVPSSSQNLNFTDSKSLSKPQPEQNPDSRALKPAKSDVNADIVKDDDDDFEFVPRNKSKKSKQKKSDDKKARKKSEKVKSVYKGNTLLAIIWAIVYIVMVAAVSVFFSTCIIKVANDVFAFVKDDTVVEVEIPPLATLNEVTDILYDNGLIEYPSIFKFYAQMKSDNGEFEPGVYSMSPSLNYDEMRYMMKPRISREIIRLTIPEGYTTDEIIDLFVSNGIGTREGFAEAINNAGNNENFDYWFIDELIENGVSDDRFYLLDGYLFPDTYQFYTDSSENTVIKKFLDNFENKFAEEWRTRASELGMTVDQVVNLASLIEKETRRINEFSIVSSVFTNRLKNQQQFPRLESDATIMYAMMHDTGKRADTLTGADTSYDSPYNTYLNNGLPPGPIANPGYNAINYALYPQDTSYYYFVSDNTGTTYFASTHEEHIANINKVREINEQLSQPQ